jgi:co-chaperonin GroES (HSP10)
MAAEAGADGVRDDVPADRCELVLVLDRAAPEALAEEVPPPAMPSVEALRVATVQALESGGKLRDRRLHDEVVVVRHQAERVEAPVVLVDDDPEEAEEEPAVVVVAVDRHLPSPARCDVEVAVGEDVAWQPRHPSKVRAAGLDVRPGERSTHLCCTRRAPSSHVGGQSPAMAAGATCAEASAAAANDAPAAADPAPARGAMSGDSPEPWLKGTWREWRGRCGRLRAAGGSPRVAA